MEEQKTRVSDRRGDYEPQQRESLPGHPRTGGVSISFLNMDHTILLLRADPGESCQSVCPTQVCFSWIHVGKEQEDKFYEDKLSC